jgi:ubiquinone/menaquinone biosynthesis C-methylase UbiE
MGFYERYVLPRVLDLTMRNSAVKRERERYVPLASGRVLEVGMGSGLNIPFYSPSVEKLYGLDPSPELGKMARERARAAPFPVEIIEQSGESIPLRDDSFDTVISTWTLCTIPDPVRALREMRRVLKPEGRFVFVEHGRSPDDRVRVWQDRLNGLWRRFGGGCNLNRKIDGLILEAGFRITEIETGYIRGLKLASFLYKGLARPG